MFWNFILFFASCHVATPEVVFNTEESLTRPAVTHGEAQPGENLFGKLLIFVVSLSTVSFNYIIWTRTVRNSLSD